METYSELHFVDVGSGTEISIKDLALLVTEITGFG